MAAKKVKSPASFICIRIEENKAVLVAVCLAEDPRHRVEVTVPSYGKFEIGQRYGMGYFRDVKRKRLESYFDAKYKLLGLVW